MNKEDLLRQIAETGYNSGYGAKVSYSSYDILRFAPGALAFLLTSLGIMGLVWEPLSTKTVSALALCIGLLAFYLNPKEKRLATLKKSGDALTRIRDELGVLYAQVGAISGLNFDDAVTKLNALREDSYKKFSE